MSDESTQTDKVGKRLTRQSPWVLMAFLIHVVVVAIASIVYFAHESAADDSAPTEISVAQPAPPPEEIKLPEIVDREMPPKLQFEDITTSYSETLDDTDEQPVSESETND